MKKNNRRWLALALALVLVCSMAVVASAASTTFDYNGRNCTATLTKSSSRNDATVKISGANQVEHVSGGVDTPMYGPGVGGTVSWSAQNKPTDSSYEFQVLGLLVYEGLKRIYSVSLPGTSLWHYVEPDKPSGTYQWAIRFYAYNAPWEVSYNNQILHYGTITKAPTGTWAYDAVRVG